MKKKTSRRRIDVNVEELDRIIDAAKREPLNESGRPDAEDRTACDGGKTGAAAEYGEDERGARRSKTTSGHGRSAAGRGAEQACRAWPQRRGLRFAVQKRSASRTRKLQSGRSSARDCGEGKVYDRKSRRRWCGSWARRRSQRRSTNWNGCAAMPAGEVFTAQEPEAAGPEKYDETAAAMIAQLKYGSGVPFHRLEQTGRASGHSVACGHAVGTGRGSRRSRSSRRTMN